MNTNKTNMKFLVPVLCAGMFIYGGCAKQQSVKLDQPIAQSATTAAAAAATENPAAKAATAEPATAPLAASTISSGSIPPQSQPQQAATQAGASQTAILEAIYFDFDSTVLSDTARATLAANLEKLKAAPKAALRIEGHSDERGSDDYNLALSERRAQSAKKYLQALGFPAEKLSVLGYGEERPAVKGEGEEIWAKNRRDEFVIAR
ncbi:cell envelope biogenesis protein OmpA [Geoanaerobacter pelophilus]|uniref:Peptidoglycan-associated protein n=1 Tax=Geoanaerobacter pelophilus TaxID=60036 RepID=A0ABQ0MLQ6_9BACT|nr:OmpA family protein [Geoanaerobacter pelophilus]GAW68012.1 cell envelope biogenesis protein OmpA [Geoanaerobacter pelophilus]